MAQTATTKTTNGSVDEPSVQDLYDMIDVLKKDMGDLAKTVSNVGKAESRRAVESAKARGEAAKAAGQEQYAAMRATAREYGEEAGRYVRDQPMMALGVAAGIGFVAGIWMNSRR